MPRPIRRTQSTAINRMNRSRAREKASNNGWIKWVVISFIVVPLIGLTFKFMDKQSDDKDVLKQAHELVAKLPDYSNNAQYLDGLVDRCHGAAFEKAYKVGGRRRSNELNAEEYIKNLFTEMASAAESDGKQQVGKSLQSYIN